MRLALTGQRKKTRGRLLSFWVILAATHASVAIFDQLFWTPGRVLVLALFCHQAIVTIEAPRQFRRMRRGRREEGCGEIDVSRGSPRSRSPKGNDHAALGWGATCILLASAFLLLVSAFFFVVLEAEHSRSKLQSEAFGGRSGIVSGDRFGTILRKVQRANRSAEVLDESAAEVMRLFMQEARSFMRQFRANGTIGVSLPTMGLSGGEYWKNSPVSSNKLLRICGFLASGATHPPAGLLRPGHLNQRQLPEKSLCFLWFNERFWSRAAGGGQGRGISRVGAHIDDRELLLESLEEYEKQHRCEKFQIIPPTFALSRAPVCETFSAPSAPWSQSRASLWFLKAANGSLGTHIELMRSWQVIWGGGGVGHHLLIQSVMLFFLCAASGHAYCLLEFVCCSGHIIHTHAHSGFETTPIETIF